MKGDIKAVRQVLRLILKGQQRGMTSLYLTLAMLVVTTLSIAVGIKLLVDAVQEQSVRTGVVGGLVAGVSLAASLANLPSSNLGLSALFDRMGARIDQHLLSSVARVRDLRLHEDPSQRDRLLQLTTQDRWAFMQALVVVVAVPVLLLMMIGVGVLLASRSPVLLLLPVLVLPPMVLSLRADMAWRKVEDASQEQWRLAQRLFELGTRADSAKEVRLFGLQQQLLAQHREILDGVQARLRRAQVRGLVQRTAGWFVFTAGYIGAVLLVVHQATQAEATPGDVVLLISLGMPIVMVTGGFGAMLGGLSRLVAAARRLASLTDAVDASDAAVPVEPAALPSRLTDGISLSGVTFSYPGGDSPVLEDVTVYLPAGSVVALVGDNGAGKTTLVKLLARMYEPTAGSILVDGHDLRDVGIDPWRERLSASFQEFCQLEVVASESVGSGDLGHLGDLDVIETAAHRAGARQVIDELPQEWQTQLGRDWTGGVDLSKGQWQKVSLARGLVRHAPLLALLDEPTSALDPIAEHALFEQLVASAEQAGAAGTITLLVSHRFSTVRTADLILVLDKSRLVEVGTHTELIGKGGLYAELYELQAAHYR
jgi:ATP-binding cassette subfamily B protein